MNLVPRRFRGHRGLSGTRGLAVAGAVGFVLVPVVVAITGSSGAALGVWRFLIISIALFSFAYGLKGGVAAGVAAVCVSAAWHFADQSDPSSGAIVILRGLNYVVAGAIVGGLVDSRARALGALARHVSLSSDVIVSGADGYLDEVNPAFTRVLGHAVEDVVGRPYLDFVHPGRPGEVAGARGRARGGSRADHDVREPLPPPRRDLPLARVVGQPRSAPAGGLRRRSRHHRAETGGGARATGARRSPRGAGDEGRAAEPPRHGDRVGARRSDRDRRGRLDRHVQQGRRGHVRLRPRRGRRPQREHADARPVSRRSRRLPRALPRRR